MSHVTHDAKAGLFFDIVVDQKQALIEVSVAFQWVPDTFELARILAPGGAGYWVWRPWIWDMVAFQWVPGTSELARILALGGAGYWAWRPWIWDMVENRRSSPPL